MAVTGSLGTVFWLAVAATIGAGLWAAVRREWRIVAVAAVAVVLAVVVRFQGVY